METAAHHETDGGVERHVVLVGPEIHWNTGNIGRTCLGAGALLHLIEPLGFSLDSQQVKRAGLDYWHRVRLHVWPDFKTFLGRMTPQPGEVALFSKLGARPYWQMPRPGRLFLVYGSETRGLPAPILDRYPQNLFYIPITAEIRSLNLSTAVGITLYESIRSLAPSHGYPVLPGTR